LSFKKFTYAFDIALFLEQAPDKISDNHKEFQLSILREALSMPQNQASEQRYYFKLSGGICTA